MLALPFLLLLAPASPAFYSEAARSCAPTVNAGLAASAEPSSLSGISLEMPLRVGDAKLAGKLCSYLQFEENWDGEGAARPSEDAIFAAISFLEMIPDGLEGPRAMALATGDVALYWDRGETYAEIGFDGAGRLYAYGTRPGWPPVHVDDRPLDPAAGVRNFPTAIHEMLTAEEISVAA